ncbi:MFS transporter, DHA1 family, inner membrane transport protein [Seinonella peptonophila]|uniref:MFS transporter, DHA1 family, inner membrane transport protein n=1 Tax=Seinonella peptonophila TaxID=112248 RepID=A0A1M5BLE5_9BACL|nr:MFS transporter [Seinonella peptonophila]SHF43308.1 MFS transporter, DHA1 family, inner membrane transport protein [Seinonella peptonophila]
MEKTRFPLALYILTFSVFAIGTTEFIIMGLLPEISQDLHISIATAGTLVSGYALTIAFGGPIISVLTSSISKKTLLLLLMIIFILGNVVSALSETYWVLMLSRIITALCHGVFFGVSSVMAANMVSSDKQGSAIALVFAGVTIANVVGVPLGTFIGQLFGWQSAFWSIVILGVLAFILIFIQVPTVKKQPNGNPFSQIPVLYRPKVLSTLLMSVLFATGISMLFAYLSTILQDISKFSPGWTSFLLALVGIGSAIGIIWGGKAADKNLIRSSTFFLLALAAVMILFSFADQNQITTIITVFLFGLMAFSVAPAVQSRIVQVAPEAPELASSMNVSAINLGNALGPFIGGFVIKSSYGLHAVSWVGAIVILLTVVVVLFNGFLDRNMIMKKA